MKSMSIWKKVLCICVAVLVAAALVFVYAWNHTPIPKLYLEGDISEMQKKSDVRSVAFSYDDGDQNYSGYAEIKVQGTSSLAYEKKNYTLKFYEDEAHDSKMKIDVGWGPQNKYCMKANWIDRTHARNVVTARLASQMQAKYDLLTDAPKNGLVDGFPIEIYNNGEFLGLYTFNIPKDAWQFAMDEDNPDHIVICGEGWDDANLFKAEPDFATWAVEVSEESDETLEKMKRLFNFVNNSSDEEFKENFEEYLNLDSALNYYIMTDLAYLADNRGKNMLIATYDGLHWYLSLYDLDTSWGTDYSGLELWDYEHELVKLDRSRLFERMETVFSAELAQRYFELREELLSNENIMAEFESFRDQIPALTFLKEIVRWGEGTIRKREELPGAEYDQIRQYLDSVSARLDEKYSAWLAE